MYEFSLQSIKHISCNPHSARAVNIFYKLFFDEMENTTFVPGEMAEWSNAAVLKTVVRATEPGVRIPLSPQ